MPGSIPPFQSEAISHLTGWKYYPTSPAGSIPHFQSGPSSHLNSWKHPTFPFGSVIPPHWTVASHLSSRHHPTSLPGNIQPFWLEPLSHLSSWKDPTFPVITIPFLPLEASCISSRDHYPIPLSRSLILLFQQHSTFPAGTAIPPWWRRASQHHPTFHLATFPLPGDPSHLPTGSIPSSRTSILPSGWQHSLISSSRKSIPSCWQHFLIPFSRRSLPPSTWQHSLFQEIHPTFWPAAFPHSLYQEIHPSSPAASSHLTHPMWTRVVSSWSIPVINPTWGNFPFWVDSSSAFPFSQPLAAFPLQRSSWK
nr:uncharacterized protein LOC113460744 [Zonotrichia albicollis]